MSEPRLPAFSLSFWMVFDFSFTGVTSCSDFHLVSASSESAPLYQGKLKCQQVSEILLSRGMAPDQTVTYVDLSLPLFQLSLKLNVAKCRHGVLAEPSVEVYQVGETYTCHHVDPLQDPECD